MTTPTRGFIRLGDYWFKPAEGLDDPELGFSFRRFPIARQWESLFAERQVVAGSPGVQNVRAEDLRWVQTSFSGGSGQSVLVPGDEENEDRFDHSEGLDFSVPGQVSLGRQMLQQGSTGGGLTTHDGNTFSDEVGTSTVVSSTDRRLNAIGDRISKTTASLTSAAIWQFEFHAYRDAGATILGNTLVEVDPNVKTTGGNPSANSAWLKNEGARAKTAQRSPYVAANGVAEMNVVYQLKLTNNSGGNKEIKVKASVIEEGGSPIVDAKQRVQTALAITPTVFTVTCSFKPKQGKNYRYHMELLQTHNNVQVEVLDITETFTDNTDVTWRIKDNTATVVGQGHANVNATATGKVITAAITIGTTGTHEIEWEWGDGGQKPILDKVVMQLVTIFDPWGMELGADDKTWLITQKNTDHPQVLYWDPALANWVVVGSLTSSSGVRVVAMCHSDNYEFGAFDNGRIWRFKAPSTVTQITSGATSNPIAGMTVGGGRLWVLTEAPANGPELFEGDLEVNPVVLTARSTGMTLPKGNTADQTLMQRIAGTSDGCVFFANDGPDCRVYRFVAGSGGGAGQNLAHGSIPTGFRGRALVHGLGFTWIGGGQAVTLPSGSVRRRPFVYVISPDGNASELPVKLYLDDDEGVNLKHMQLYGTDLWVLTAGDDPAGQFFRLWRIDLNTQAAYVVQDVHPDTSQAAGQVRAMSITWRERFVIWSRGAPYREGPDYITAFPAEWFSSTYTFGLIEPKTLMSMDLAADIPTGTSVELLYSLDGGATTSAGVLTASGTQRITTADTLARFSFLRMGLRLASSNPAVTPTVYAVGSRAFLQEYRKGWEMLLLCANQISTYHQTGQAVRGAVAASYLHQMADTAGVVEFEDHFTDPTNPQTYLVQITDPEQVLTNPGESYVRVFLLER